MVFVKIYLIRIDDKNRNMVRNIVDQAGRRVYLHRGADHDKNVRFLGFTNAILNVRNRLSKPDNVRS